MLSEGNFNGLIIPLGHAAHRGRLEDIRYGLGCFKDVKMKIKDKLNIPIFEACEYYDKKRSEEYVQDEFRNWLKKNFKK